MEAFERILNKTTEIVRKRRVKPKNLFPASFDGEVLERARQILNETVAISMQHQFLQAMDLDEASFVENAAAALKYLEVIDRFNSLGFEYPTASIELRGELERTAKGLDSNGSPKSKRPLEWWEANFYPEAISLFAALFQEKPTASFNPDTNTLPGAALVFVSEVITEVKVSKNADSLFFAAGIDGIEMDDWQFHSKNALRKKLYFWMNKPSKTSKSMKLWEEYRQFYDASLRDGDE